MKFSKINIQTLLNETLIKHKEFVKILNLKTFKNNEIEILKSIHNLEGEIQAYRKLLLIQ